jgi:cell division protein FtsB
MKRSGDYLKDNPDYNFVWKQANSMSCIDNAVTVDHKYFVGRAVEGDTTFFGNVMVGSVGLRYLSREGIEVVSNNYEVLTCEEKGCSRENIAKCEKEVISLKNEVNSQKEENENLEEDLSSCKRDLINEKSNTQLMRQFLKHNNDTLNKCLADLEAFDCQRELEACLRKPACPPQRTCPPSSGGDDLRAQIERLKGDIEERDEEITQLNFDKNDLKLEVKSLKNEIRVIKKSAMDQFESLNRTISDFEQTYTGSAGCLESLRKVKTLSEEEMREILDVIKEKLPVGDD